MGEPVGVGAYPPSAFSIVPRLVERAGADGRSGGSITAVYTALAEGADLDDPIVDAARAATDGHIVLSRSLAEQGVFPAIDVGASLSRTMPDVIDERHLADAMTVRHSWSLATEYRELQMLGGLGTGPDPAIDAMIAKRSAILDFIRQPRGLHVPLAQTRQALAEVAGQ